MNIIERDSAEIAKNLGGLSHRFEGKTILITGSGGFLGTLFTQYFLFLNKNILKKKCKLILGDCFIIGQQPKFIEDENVRNVNLDICSPLTNDFFPENVHFILNCAGIADPNVYCRLPKKTLSVGLDGTRNILDFAIEKRVESIMLFSSSEIFAHVPDHLIPTPELDYSTAKLKGERAAYDTSKSIIITIGDMYHRQDGVPVKYVLPFNVAGPGLSLKDKRVLSAYTKSALENKPITVFGEGLETRTLTYTSDFITGAIKVLLIGRDNELYNIASDQTETTMRDLAYLVEKIAEKTGLVQFVEPPLVYKIQPPRRKADITKARTELGYEPKVGIEETIRRYLEWAKENL